MTNTPRKPSVCTTHFLGTLRSVVLLSFTEKCGRVVPEKSLTPFQIENRLFKTSISNIDEHLKYHDLIFEKLC